MKKSILSYIFILSFLIGCATTTTPPEEKPVIGFDNEAKQFIEKEINPEPAVAPKEDVIEDVVVEEEVEQRGVVFAKTQFEGVLKTNFVRLTINNVQIPERSYQLHIGEKAAANQFPWTEKTVNPGYFYIELPEGEYKISNVTIPVGSSTAVEKMDVRFNVIPNQISYLGTLKLNGTKEKIKLGKEVPLIKPGFEFTAEVLDQMDEAARELRDRFPAVSGEITSQLMAIY